MDTEETHNMHTKIPEIYITLYTMINSKWIKDLITGQYQLIKYRKILAELPTIMISEESSRK